MTGEVEPRWKGGYQPSSAEGSGPVKPLKDRRRSLAARTKRRQKIAGLSANRETCRSMANGLCQAGTPACPQGPHRGEQAHHRQLRSQGGSDDPTNLLWVCPAAHAHIHAHPAESYAAGWLRRSYDR